MELNKVTTTKHMACLCKGSIYVHWMTTIRQYTVPQAGVIEA